MPRKPKMDPMTHAEWNLRHNLPHYATAIGNPTSPAEYLRDVVRHNLGYSRSLAERGKHTASGRMTGSQRKEFVMSMAHVKVARQMLRVPQYVA